MGSIAVKNWGKYTKCAFVLFGLLMVTAPAYSQVKQSHSIVLGFLQLKDEFGLGMAFNGVQLEYRYGLHWKISEHEILYQPKLGLGTAFKRGMLLAHVNIAPVNVTWTMPFFERDGHKIRGGANFIMDYNYQLYNELHDGPIFWNAEFGLSPVINYSYQWDEKRIIASFQNSLLGFTSRRQGIDDPYKFLFTWKDFVVYPHEDMKFGSFNNYNHTKLSFEFVPDIFKKHSFAYEFDYFSSFYGYRYDRINHNLVWRMSL
jgi:hypothetical protein